MFEVVPIDRTAVLKPKLLEQQSGKNHAFGKLFGTTGKLLHVTADVRDLAQQLPRFFTHLPVKLACNRSAQVRGDRPDIFRDRHLIVVEDYEEIFSKPSSVMQTFERHAGRHRPITDDTHDFMFLLQLLTAFYHTKSSRHPSPGMSSIECVVFTFFPLAEPAQPSVLAKRMELFAATGQEFMRIGLVTGVPDNLVGRRIEEILQGNRELNHTQI